MAELSARYAAALFELALEENLKDEFREQAAAHPGADARPHPPAVRLSVFAALRFYGGHL